MTDKKSPQTPKIPIDQIYVTERYRKKFGDINDLAFSIQKQGLINPITVCLRENMEGKLKTATTLPYILMAGERRLRAVRSLNWETVPVHINYQSLNELDFRAVELAENFNRLKMDYSEELALMLEIDRLQVEIHGEKISNMPDAKGWSQTDTAELLDKSPSSISKDLKLARIMEKHPEFELHKCKNKHDAYKKLTKIRKTISNNIRAEEFSKNNDSVPDKVFSKLSSNYILKDCREILSKMTSDSMKFIEIDPPYAIDLNKTKRNNQYFGYNEIEADDYITLMPEVLKECYRVLKQNSWLICWFAPHPWFEQMYQWIVDAGFSLRRMPAIWAKPSGQTQQPEMYLGSNYEMFFYARKGKAVIQKPGRSNIFTYPGVVDKDKFHPTQRPLSLMIDIYQTFAPINSNGFIPFLGSGVGILAGYLSKMNMIGCDLTKEYKDGYIISLKEFLDNYKEEDKN